MGLKDLFHSSSKENLNGGDLANRSSLDGRGGAGKAADAHKKNDELASRLGKSPSSPSTSTHNNRDSTLSSTSSTDRTSAQRANDNISSGSNQGYDTSAPNTSSVIGTGDSMSNNNRNSLSSDMDKRTGPLAEPSGPHGIAGVGAGTTGGRGVLDPENDGMDAYESRNESMSDRDLGRDANIPHAHRNSLGGSGAPSTAMTGVASGASMSTGPTSGAPLGSSAPPTSEKVGTGRLSRSMSGRGYAPGVGHEDGHRVSAEHHAFDPTVATHDHQHLQHVVHKDVRHVEVEEVERQREVDRHVHHVQMHVQPVVDRVEQAEVIHENLVAPTNIRETHQSTDEDVNLFRTIATEHKSTESYRPKERTVVDLGEKVTENVHHHVHHVTQPIIEQEIVERHRIHTVIPVHHVTHEAPIIHKSSTHAPVSMSDFLSGGGKLDSRILAADTGLLPNGECERTVSGEAENLVKQLNLGPSKFK